jgi:hypothetical protein
MPQRRKPGRPVTVPQGEYLTVKFTGAQVKAINRLAGPAPGRRPAMIRELLDLGIKVARAR